MHMFRRNHAWFLVYRNISLLTDTEFCITDNSCSNKELCESNWLVISPVSVAELFTGGDGAADAGVDGVAVELSPLLAGGLADGLSIVDGVGFLGIEISVDLAEGSALMAVDFDVSAALALSFAAMRSLASDPVLPGIYCRT